MTHLLLLLVVFACVGISAAWIAENPGNVTIHWGDHRADMSFAVLIGVSLIASLALIAAYATISKIIYMPSRWSQRRELKYYEKGLAELTWSVAALAASDVATAEVHTRKAEKALGVTPITLLLAAQIARSQGDDAKTQKLLEQMLEHEETEYLAARLLSESAGKQKLFPKALALAQRAQAASPHEHTAALSVVSLNVRLSNWQEAQKALMQSAKKAKLPHDEVLRLRGVILLAQAMKLSEDGSDEAALATARKSLKYLPAFPPAIITTAQCYNEMGAKPKAVKLLLSSWKKIPHPHIAETLRAIVASDAPEKREKILKKLGGALHDSGNLLWRCGACGEPTQNWQAHCPLCGSFDTLQVNL